MKITVTYRPRVGDVIENGWRCMDATQDHFKFLDEESGTQYCVRLSDLWMWHGLTVYREEEVTGKPLLTIKLLDDEELFSVGGQKHLYDALVEAGARKGDTLHVIKAEGE